MQLNVTAFIFLLKVELIISRFAFSFANFVPQNHFEYDLEVLTMIYLQILDASTAQIWPLILEVFLIFALLILNVRAVYVYPYLLDDSAIFVTHTLAVRSSKFPNFNGWNWLHSKFWESFVLIFTVHIKMS